MSDPLYPFIGATVAAVVSGYPCQQARREGRRAFAWTMGLASGAFALGALYFGNQV